MIGICLIIGVFKVSITDIININGSVIGFLFIYFMPALLHVKCMYFSKGKRPFEPPQDQQIHTLPISIEPDQAQKAKGIRK